VLEGSFKMVMDPELLSEEKIKRIEEGLEDLKKGRKCTEDEVAVEMGLEY